MPFAQLRDFLQRRWQPVEIARLSERCDRSQLVVRSAALFLSARHSLRPLCTWVYLAAAVDLGLAVLLLGGLPIAVLVYGLFGTTDEITGTFSWVFAASFVAAGWLLIAAAPLEASETD